MDAILTRSEFERKMLLPDKTTVVMATCQSSLKCFMLSPFSLLLRSSPLLEHVIVTINGPDGRTGDPSRQDAKQAFLEELRNTRWQASGQDRDMPLTVIRTWSRIGHSHATDGAIPWVHTEFYTIMHDDVFIREADWPRYAVSALEDRKVGFVYAPPLLTIGASVVNCNGGRKLTLPHPNSAFITARKEVYTGMGLRWYGYHLPKKVDLRDVDMEHFLEFHGADAVSMPTTGQFDYVSMDIGTWIYHRMKKEGYRFEPLPSEYLVHLAAMSWRDESSQEATLSRYGDIIFGLENEIGGHRPLARLYDKYASCP